jgi:hypothetical protein
LSSNRGAEEYLSPLFTINIFFTDQFDCHVLYFRFFFRQNYPELNTFLLFDRLEILYLANFIMFPHLDMLHIYFSHAFFHTFFFSKFYFQKMLRLPRSSIIIYNEKCSNFSVITSIFKTEEVEIGYRPHDSSITKIYPQFFRPSCILHTVNFFSVFNIFIFLKKRRSYLFRKKLKTISENEPNK